MASLIFLADEHCDLQAGLRGDSYANLSLGNIYFSNLEDRTKYERHLLHAANFYHEVLKKDDANAFSGIVVVWKMSQTL